MCCEGFLLCVASLCDAFPWHWGRHLESPLKQVCRLVVGKILCTVEAFWTSYNFFCLGLCYPPLWLAIHEQHEVRKENVLCCQELRNWTCLDTLKGEKAGANWRKSLAWPPQTIYGIMAQKVGLMKFVFSFVTLLAKCEEKKSPWIGVLLDYLAELIHWQSPFPMNSSEQSFYLIYFLVFFSFLIPRPLEGQEIKWFKSALAPVAYTFFVKPQNITREE